VGIVFFSFGLISILYGIITLIIRISIGFIEILYVKDLLFDFVFLLLGFLIIRQNRRSQPQKRHVKRYKLE